MRRRSWSAVLWLAFTWVGPAMACQWRLDLTVEQFFQADAERAVVFVGEVAAIAHGGPDESPSLVAFRAKEVLWGDYDPEMPVRVIRPAARKMGCEELDNGWSPAMGSQWLIFGKVVDGAIVPDPLLSREVRHGEVPPGVRELLQRYGRPSRAARPG